MPAVHGFLANAVYLFVLGVALFALFRMVRRQPLGSDFWGAVVIGEALIIIQALVGILTVVLIGLQPADGYHYLYGVLAVALWPATYSYTQPMEEQRKPLIWFGVSLFMFVMLLIRAGWTGSGA